MKALTDLFSTDYGLMSITGIVIMLLGSAYFFYFVRRKMNENPSPASDNK